jgi:hypothetical protein
VSSSASDFLSTSTPSQPLAWQLMGMTPQYRLNETAPNLTQDSSIASTRALQDYQQRTVPDLVNQSAAMGNFGSSGAANKLQRSLVDYRRNQNDISRMFNRQMASIAKNKIMATMGGMF